ncbi:hypothetical protein MRX96_020957 [Rhipicephalus microplus]
MSTIHLQEKAGHCPRGYVASREGRAVHLCSAYSWNTGRTASSRVVPLGCETPRGRNATRCCTWTVPLAPVSVSPWNERGYSRDQRSLARDLHEALQQFFTLFPRFAKRTIFTSRGESYAGKYATTVAHLIATTLFSRVDIKLRGIAVGNAWLDPETMLDYAQFLYHIGLVDRRQADHIQRKTERAVELARHGRFADAFEVMDHLLEGLEASTSYFKNVSGISTPYNFVQAEDRMRRDLELYRSFVRTHEFRRAVHVGNVAFNSGREAASNLLVDVMRSVKPSFLSLLERDFKVLVYSGQLDAVVPHSLAVDFLSGLQWSGTEYLRRGPAEGVEAPDVGLRRRWLRQESRQPAPSDGQGRGTFRAVRPTGSGVGHDVRGS